MRTAAVLLLVAALAAGCTGQAEKEATPGGCGLVPAERLTGLLGADVGASGTGSLHALRDQHTRVFCRTVATGHPERYVTLRAEYHPRPYRLPAKACSEGWVYAGTPAKYTPACQETVHGHGRTELVVRWQPYLMHVVVGRSDRDWGGDPERALALSRVLAQRLGVREARGDG